MTESGINIREIPNSDEDYINMDKENLPRQIFTNKTAEMDRVASCPRTPLRSINQARNGAICPVYSPITPVSGARSRTPLSGRKSRTPRNRRKTVCDFRRKQSPMNVMNTLLYNKAKELIEQGLQEERDMRKELEALVAAKDKEILQLKAEVSRLSGQITDASTLQDTSISMDNKSATTSDCKSSDVDYLKRTKDELVTELEASEIRYKDLHSEFESVHQQYHLLERELVRARAARAAEGVSVSNAFELVKVSLEQKIVNLQTSQSQLRREISEREKEVASCRSELQQLEKEVTTLNESLAKSRDDMSRIYEQKQQESELCGEYRNQRQKDIVRMQELESQLNEFAQIRPNIIKARLAQEKLANVIRKAHQSALETKQAVNAEREEFLKQKVEWLKWKDEKEQSLAAIQEECDGIQEEKLANVIRKAHQSALETKQAVNAEREEFLKQKVEWLKWKDEKEQSLAAIQEECDGIQEVNQRQGGRSQREQLSSAESRIDCLQKQIVCLESSVDNEKRINQDLTEKLNLTEKQMTNLNEQMAADVERHELEVTNLQRTLDMREHEFDELTKGCNSYKRLVTHLQTQTTKQQAIISKVAELERQIELLEREKTIVSNEMCELRKKAAELRQLTTDHQALLEKTQSLETNLIDKEQQIRCKEAELSNAVTVVELLSKKASSFFDKLTSQWRAWNKTSQGVKAATEATGTPSRRRSQARTPVTSGCRRRSRKSFGAPSFVCQILSASKQNTEPHSNKTIPVIKLYGSTAEGKSATDNCIVIGHDEATELTTREPESEMSPSTRRRGSQDSNCSDGNDVISLHSSSSSSYGERFTSFVDEIATIFTKMESLLHGEVISAFSQLRNLVRSLEGHLSQQQQTHVRQMKDAQMAMRQAIAEAGDQQRKADVAIQRSANLEDELKEKTERAIQLDALLQNKKDRLIELSDQATEIKKLSKDLTSARQKCELNDEEIRLLKSSLNERWQGIETNPDASATVVKEMDKEIISLKIQKEKLMQNHADDKRNWEESCFRLEEQHRNDMRNLKRAEDAIGQLDEKIERLRLALQPHLNILKADKRLHPILCEIRAVD